MISDICDGHPDDVAAHIDGSVVGMGKKRIIVVPCIGGIDRHKGEMRQVFAPLTLGRPNCVRLGNNRIRKSIWNSVLVDCDERNSLRRTRITEPGHHPGPREAQSILWPGLFRLDQFAVFCAADSIGGNAPFPVRPLVDWHNAPALGRGAKHAQQFTGICADAPDQPALIGMVLGIDIGQPRQHAVALSKRRVRCAQDHQDPWFHAFALPLERTRKKITVNRGSGNL